MKGATIVADIDIASSELLAKNNFSLEIRPIELSTCRFCYYTRFNVANDILLNKSFHINSLANMNDKDEERMHDAEKNDVFALCFCNSNSEKIPMWYIYSGIAGNGVSIIFTQSLML